MGVGTSFELKFKAIIKERKSNQLQLKKVIIFTLTFLDEAKTIAKVIFEEGTATT